MKDVYAAPEADLVRADKPQGHGSLATAITGDYPFRIREVLSEAWTRTRGAKGKLIMAYLCLILFTVLVLLVMEGLTLAIIGGALQEEGTTPLVIVDVIKQLVITAVTTPVSVGLFLLGVRRSVGAPMPLGSLFDYFHRTFRLFVTTLLLYILVFIGFVLLVLPGIYLSVSYTFATALVAEKGLSPWHALETSRKAISRKWWRMFGLYLVLGLINLLGSIPLGLGLIWTLPLSALAMGILYRNMFGVEGHTVA